MTKAGSAQPAPGTGLRPAYEATRAHLTLVVVLIALAGVGWWWTIQQMRGMDNGPWTNLGTFGWFISVWVVMMAAMMFPSVAPTVALYARMSRNRLAPMVFVTGYLFTWTGAGVVAFLVGVLAGHAVPDLGWEHAGRILTGATLLVAAAYELTPLKNICLTKCRSPLGQLLGSWRDGQSGALGMGMTYPAIGVLATEMASGGHEVTTQAHYQLGDVLGSAFGPAVVGIAVTTAASHGLHLQDGLLIGFSATCAIVLAALFASGRLPRTSSNHAAPYPPTFGRGERDTLPSR